MAFILRPEYVTTKWTHSSKSTSLETPEVSTSCYSLSAEAMTGLRPENTALPGEIPIELKDLPSNFSMSKLLSPAADRNQAQIVNDAIALDGTHLICLALNEQCRTSERGYLYHLPLRQNKLEGHPCDAVFVDGTWSSESKARWDKGDWVDRLNIGSAMTTLPPGQKVIPLCLRIFGLEGAGVTARDVRNSDWDDLLRPDFGHHDPVHCNAHHYLSRTDPAVQPDIHQYSRPVEDVSIYLVTYDSQWSTPFVCKTAVAEHESLTRRFPTPNDVSETYVRSIDGMTASMHREAEQSKVEAARRAAALLSQGGVGSHYAVISALVKAWVRDDENHAVDHDRPLFGKSTLLWQEVKNRADGNGLSWKADMLAVWPKEAGTF